MKDKGLRITIPKRAKECALGGGPFEEGASYVSILTELPEELKREDFSLAAWEKEGKNEERGEKVTFWKGKVPKKKEEKEDQSQDKKAVELLRKLLEEEKKEEEALAFVLTLYLERRKLLVLRKRLKAHSFYEMPETEEIFDVKTVNLLDLSIESIQTELMQRLENEESEANEEALEASLEGE